MKMINLEFSFMRRSTFRGPMRTECPDSRRKFDYSLPQPAVYLFGFFALWVSILPLHAREKDTTQYGAGLILNVPFPEADVTQAVKEVIQNGIIRGSKEYEREEYITGAEEATSTRAFRAWQEGGNVFYKVRAHALDPRNFKNGGDVGTLAVRYVVQAQGEKNTVLRIDAVFVEDSRHTVHPSNGSVEGAEYKTIHEHLEALQLIKQRAGEPEAEHRGLVNEKLMAKENPSPTFPAPPASSGEHHGVDAQPQPSGSSPIDQTPEQHLKDLRRQTERIVKSPGAALKASPFHTASTLASLPTGTEVLIVISTPYWYGIETHEGRHGWVSRDELEQLP
jgi:hypothetical protein